MPTLEYKFERFRREGIPLEHGSRITPQGTTYWAKSGNISADGFKTLGAALNAVLKAIDASEGLDIPTQNLIPFASSSRYIKRQIKEAETEESRYEYDGQYGTIEKTEAGYVATPMPAKTHDRIRRPMKSATFPSLDEAIEYLKQTIHRAKGVTGWQ
jgi:hypothetical protein